MLNSYGLQEQSRDQILGSLSQEKVLGEVGAILVLLSIIPSVGFVIAIIGLVLTLLAVKYISDALNDSSVFTNILIAIVLAIVGLVIGGIVVIGAALRFIGGLSNLAPGTTIAPPPVGNTATLVVGLIAGLPWYG